MNLDELDEGQRNFRKVLYHFYTGIGLIVTKDVERAIKISHDIMDRLDQEFVPMPIEKLWELDKERQEEEKKAKK